MFLPEPRGLRDLNRVAERRAMLQTVDAVQPLRVFAAELAARRQEVVPNFDPAEAGVDAKVLLVFESPGPRTVAGDRPGSGFISVDNDDQSAENCWRARAEVGLHDGALSWNLVPWYLGAVRKPTAAELAAGASELRRLLDRLPALRVVVLSGATAQDGWDKHVDPYQDGGVVVKKTWHPAGRALNGPGRREHFTATLRSAAGYL